MVYEHCKVSKQANLSKDGRLRINITFPDKSYKNISYPKYLMECYLDRYLSIDEIVHHLDENPLNNNLDNLCIVDRSKHSKLHVMRLETQSFVCPICNQTFILDGYRLHQCINNRRKNKAGPFCSRSCAGKYGANIQNDRMEKLLVKQCIPSYTNLKHSRAFRQETPEVDTAKSGKPSNNVDGNPELD